MRISKVPRSTGKGFHCRRCGASTLGQAQICEECLEKASKCQAPGCGKPHNGPLLTTKFCPPCRAKRRKKPRKNPPWTAEDDAKICAAYEKYNAHEVGPVLRKMFPKHPKWSISRRAQVLGAAVIRSKQPNWTAAEDAIIVADAWMSPERIQLKLKTAGFPRTVTAVSIRMKRLRVSENIDSMGANALAKMLNVDIHAVLLWIKEGLLKAERRGTTRDNHDRYHITTENIRSFLWENPERYELSKLERVGSKGWFLELVSGGRIAETGKPSQASAQAPSAAPALLASPDRTVPLYGERVTLTALSEISGRTVADLLHRIDGLGLSVNDAAFGGDDVGASGTVSPITEALVAQIRALMKSHRAKPADLARWSALPISLVERVLAGDVALVIPAAVTMVHHLNADLQVTLAPRK